jgi:ribosomal protein S13
MVYIFSKNLRINRSLNRELRKIPGLGRVANTFLATRLGLNPRQTVGALTNRRTNDLLNQIHQNFFVGPDLAQLERGDLARLCQIGALRGLRQVIRTRQKLRRVPARKKVGP